MFFVFSRNNYNSKNESGGGELSENEEGSINIGNNSSLDSYTNEEALNAACNKDAIPINLAPDRVQSR